MPGGRNYEMIRLSKAQDTLPKKTDIDKLWSRPLDFNDHNTIFNHQRRNEFDNSFRFIQSFDLTELRESVKIVQSPVNLHCDEEFNETPSDTENYLTIDSDDSVKDKDYVPDTGESSSDEDASTSLKKDQKQQSVQKKGEYDRVPTVPDVNNPTMDEEENRETEDTENRKNASPSLEIDQNQQSVQEEDQYYEVPTVPNVNNPTIDEEENGETEDTENRKNVSPSLEIDQNQQSVQEEDQYYDVPTVPNVNNPPIDEKENGETEDPENRKNASPSLEIDQNQQSVQEEDQYYDVPTVPNVNNPTIDEEENRDPSQEDPVTDQQLQENDVEETNAPRTSETVNQNNRQEIQVSLTKSGKPRKRRTFTETKEERMMKKNEEKKQKLEIKPSCQESCKKKCNTNITEEQRKKIHDSYVNMSYEEQGIFIKCMITQKPVQRRLTSSAAQRKNTLVYNLKVENSPIEVCKSYFLTSLGYNPNNDCRIRSALKKPLHEQTTKRGSYERKDKIDRQKIEDHIKTFNPCISHYRREHAPNRLYLPSDITIKQMHEQFCLQYPDLKVSQELYRVVVKEMNISFARLGHEECEQCAIFKNHNPNHNEQNIMNEACDECLNYVVHNMKYTEARDEYKSDAAKVNNTDEIFYSVDLQKVIMLPRIDQYKTAVFCTRIIAFNESFVPIGQPDERHVPFAAIWNETISGRNQEDLISTFYAFLLHNRDAKHITLWLDNCAAQNKNWALLSFLVQIVNSDLIAAKSITLKYFETGHTFMSADSFHHQVEMALKRMDKVYDFHDFVECVKSTNSKKNFVKVMNHSDFHEYRDYASQHKLRKNEPRIYLKDMVAVKVEREQYTLKFKESHGKHEVYETLDFLQTKIVKTEVFPAAPTKMEPRGISEERKKAIIAKLVPLMPENRRKFWCDLPVSDAKDLALND